jgi:hypothetical protein
MNKSKFNHKQIELAANQWIEICLMQIKHQQCFGKDKRGKKYVRK